MPDIKEVTVFGSNKWSDLKPFDVSSDKLRNIEWTKYYDTIHPKNQIVLHHTVSGPGITGDLKTWENYKANIGTCVVIDRDGTVNQLFSSKHWAYHLGCGKKDLDKQSIGIEIDNWGQLEEKEGKLYAIYGNKVDVETVHYPLGFRGEQIFEAYTEAQIRTIGELLLLWNKRYGISLEYHEDMWDVSERALDGESGVWAHVSYRPYPSKHNKWDAHPDPNLIAMLKTISGLVI